LVNASLETSANSRLIEALDLRILHRTILETTEHAIVEDFDFLRR
jgi:hypothetical protein